MKVKFFAINLVVTLLFFGLLKSPVFADCEVASFDQNTRNLTVCVGEFSTKDALKSTTAHFNCLNNSNMVPGGLCSGITGPTNFSLSGTPDDEIVTDSNGKYYTCITAQGINRAIGSINVSFSGGTTCTTSSFTTKPNDWNYATEGMPWNKGTNDPVPSDSIHCPDGKSINTALGCIDVTSPDLFITTVLRFATGIGGGIALALILYGVFIVTTSAGMPDKLKAGGEIITSAIVGLIFIIISIFLFKLIGINILGIPGLI